MDHHGGDQHGAPSYDRAAAQRILKRFTEAFPDENYLLETIQLSTFLTEDLCEMMLVGENDQGKRMIGKELGRLTAQLELITERYGLHGHVRESRDEAYQWFEEAVEEDE